jgi:hypothetical protein
MFKNLNKIISKDLRIIEFSAKKSVVQNYTSIRNRFLSVLKSSEVPEDNTITLQKKKFIHSITQNSSDVVILNCAGWKELKALQSNTGAKLFLERINAYNIFFLVYFLFTGILRSRIKFNGLFYLRRGLRIALYLGLKSKKSPNPRTRHYLSPLVKVEHFFRQLNEENVKYSILRWFEELPYIKVNEDVDILVDDEDLSKVHSIIDAQPGIIPFDIYSTTGLPGSDFKSLPYYPYSLATQALDNAVLHKKIFKVPIWENYFYLLAYHVVFHKGENAGLTSKRYKLDINTNPDHDYLDHLRGILTKTDLNVNDFTLEGLHTFLEERGYAPPLDTQYKLSLQNQYLKAYLDEFHSQSDLINKFEGLVSFIAREKIVEAGLIEELEKLIAKEGFTIISTKKLEGEFKDNLTKGVRGGNWNQGPWPTSGGPPSALIVALDVYPVEPEQTDQYKHPGLTNKRIQDKNRIRDLLNSKFPDKNDWCNGVHSSDNEIQAVEYLELAGFNKDVIFNEVEKYKNIFRTKYPVIKVLSRYSRRAKIELISYKGKKAVLKTFKPKCEWFLANEIEAYRVFENFEEVPKLLEVGDNYIITEYIEEGKPLEGKINIKTLKKCLNILRKVYDKGYSLLDFRPTNFLRNKNKKLYLIDFEFLHHYEQKPSFLECYDLVGIPADFDPLRVPIVDVPEGEYQFDVLWGRKTGIFYEDLLRMNDFKTHLKSIVHFYRLKMKKLLSILKGKSLRGIKLIHRALP